MANTPMRALRISDPIWDNAKFVAEHNNTNVTALIVTFLKKLHIEGNPTQTALTVATRACKKRPVPKHLEPYLFKPGHVKSPKKVNKRDCTHPNIKTIPYGTFCVACGTRIT